MKKKLDDKLEQIYRQNLALVNLRASEYDRIKNKRNQVSRCDFCDRVIDEDIKYCYECKEFSE